VRIALQLKKLKYAYRAIHLVKDGGEQLKDEFARLNPMKQVPALAIESSTSTADSKQKPRVLAQSRAIIEYLDEQYPEVPLLPTDPYLRAKTRQLAEIVSSGIQPIQNLAVLLRVKAKLDNAEKMAWGAHFIRIGFEALEEAVQETVGTYCVGDAVTVADLCLVPQLYNARRFSVDLTPFPTLLRIEAALVKLPAFKAAHPDEQPDFPAPAAK
jgi:maleylpyruvate isomerase